MAAKIPKYSRILIFAHIYFRFCISSEFFARNISFKAFYTKRLILLEKTDRYLLFFYVNMQNNGKLMGFCYDTFVFA
jgi:hypothetical protein